MKIHCESYEPLAEYVYNNEKIGCPIPKGVKSVFCHCDNIAQLFRENESADPYVLISAQSDYGPCYQAEHPVGRDMAKWVNFIKFEDIGYQGIPPRCNLKECREEDKYSIKCYSFTKSTFSAVPHNVRHWFCTNSDIDETINLPFGAERGNIDKIEPKLKTKLIYYNCVAYSIERYHLFHLCSKLRHVTLRQNVSHEEFLEDLGTHCMVICPISNGIDSYRIWQSLYAGAVPVVQKNRTFSQFSHLPIIQCDNLFEQLKDEDWLVSAYESELDKFDALGYLDLDFWRKRIESAVSEC